MPKRYTATFAFLLLFASLAQAQQNRITGTIDDSRRVVLYGHINPKTQAAMDQGRVRIFAFASLCHSGFEAFRQPAGRVLDQLLVATAANRLRQTIIAG